MTQKNSFHLGFNDGVKLASSKNPAAPVKGHDFGQTVVNSAVGAYLNTRGGAHPPAQTAGDVGRSHAPGRSLTYQGHTVPGGDLGVNSSPDTGDRGRSDTGPQAVTKSASTDGSWLTEMFGDDA